MLRDLQLALRVALRRPWLTLSVVCLVGVALAVNAALFSALHLFVLRDVPVDDPSTLVIVEREPARPVPQSVLDALQGYPSFHAVGAVVAGNESSSDPGVFIARTTSNLAAVLGVSPARGRWLSDEDPDGVVIAWSLWQARFGGDVTTLGRPIEIGGRRRALAGVMPAGFDFPSGSNAWELAVPPTGVGYTRFASLTAIGRVRAPSAGGTVTLDADTLSLVPFLDRYAPSRPQALTLLLLGAALVLGLTVLHLAAFGLTQITRQRADAAIRVALGAERRHLIRQTVTDAAVPVLGGLVLALVLTPAIQAAAGRWLPPEVLRGSALLFDGPTFAAGSLLAVLVVGIISAVRLPAIPWRNPKNALTTSGVARPAARRMARAVLMLQTACAVTLLFLCGLAVMSLQAVQQVDLGFTSSRLMVVHVPWGTLPLDVQRGLTSRVDDTVAALTRVPGVVAAAPTMAFPLSTFRAATVVTLPDNTTSRVELPHVGPGYLNAIGARLLSGRDFAVTDGPPPLMYTIVSRSLAEAVTRDGELPRSISVGGLPHEIIGVVDDVRMWRPELPPDFQAYVSIIQRRAPATAIVVRTSDNDVAPAALSTAIQGLWSDAPARVEVVDDTLHRLTAPQRTRAVLMFALALAGLALTLVALAGGLNEGVRSRRKELAVRIALGADSGRLVRAVIGEALVIVVAGIGLGLVAGVMAHRLLPEVFSGADGADVRTVGVVALTFVLVALIASARAALLACRVDPAHVLSAN